ncbi:hypothetical protein MATL_G00176400 [Megalops atlanticus]|uniref:Uncharacterized protein n=1 Tax=Megalops atlanticus TaxID=7932 RepID=A0A9D3PLV9_MEGAT|nr:hypothetical protein MATL_G00176400 [Megalops atlanticus]
MNTCRFPGYTGNMPMQVWSCPPSPTWTEAGPSGCGRGQPLRRGVTTAYTGSPASVYPFRGEICTTSGILMLRAVFSGVICTTRNTM